jgi:hypothetical protein
MSPEVITAVITGGIGAFTGLSRALNPQELDRHPRSCRSVIHQ